MPNDDSRLELVVTIGAVLAWQHAVLSVVGKWVGNRRLCMHAQWQRRRARDGVGNSVELLLAEQSQPQDMHMATHQFTTLPRNQRKMTGSFPVLAESACPDAPFRQQITVTHQGWEPWQSLQLTQQSSRARRTRVLRFASRRNPGFGTVISEMRNSE